VVLERDLLLGFNFKLRNPNLVDHSPTFISLLDVIDSITDEFMHVPFIDLSVFFGLQDDKVLRVLSVRQNDDMLKEV